MSYHPWQPEFLMTCSCLLYISLKCYFKFLYKILVLVFVELDSHFETSSYFIFCSFLIVQVILVGHDFGGTCISYVMELFPHKVSKAVFVAATMLTSEQSTLDMLSQKVCTSLLSR